MTVQGFNVNLSGIDNLLEGLEKLSSGEVKRAVDEGTQKAAREMQSDAKLNVPVDSNELRESIIVTKISNGYDVGTNKEYSEYVEFGTGQRGDPTVEHVTEKEHKKGGKGTGEFYEFMGMKPQPYMYPAFDKVSKKVDGYIAESLDSAIKGVF